MLNPILGTIIRLELKNFLGPIIWVDGKACSMYNITIRSKTLSWTQFYDWMLKPILGAIL